MSKYENDNRKTLATGSSASDLAKSSGASPPAGELCYTIDKQDRSLKIEEKDFLNSDEAACYLGIDLGTLHNECSSGKIPYYKFGRRNRYRKDELKALLLANPKGERK